MVRCNIVLLAAESLLMATAVIMWRKCWLVRRIQKILSNLFFSDTDIEATLERHQCWQTMFRFGKSPSMLLWWPNLLMTETGFLVVVVVSTDPTHIAPWEQSKLLALHVKSVQCVEHSCTLRAHKSVVKAKALILTSYCNIKGLNQFFAYKFRLFGIQGRSAN